MTLSHDLRQPVQSLILFAGVLERHPHIKFFLSHGGGFLPAYSGRIDHAWGARSDSRGAGTPFCAASRSRILVDAAAGVASPRSRPRR